MVQLYYEKFPDIRITIEALRVDGESFGTSEEGSLFDLCKHLLVCVLSLGAIFHSSDVFLGFFKNTWKYLIQRPIFKPLYYYNDFKKILENTSFWAPSKNTRISYVTTMQFFDGDKGSLWYELKAKDVDIKAPDVRLLLHFSWAKVDMVQNVELMFFQRPKILKAWDFWFPFQKMVA